MRTFILFLMLGLTINAGAASLTSSVDRTRISLEETVTLKIRFDEQVMFGEPDFSSLNTEFDILNNRRNQQYRSVNGRAESWTQWTLTLAPKHQGKLLIPSFEYKGEFSEAIELDVGKPTHVTGKQKPVFLEVSLDKQQVYVQEQVLFTVRLYTSVDLNGLSSEELKIDSALIKQISENQYQKSINGKPFGVVEVTYALFPQQSGSLSIPSTLWNISLQQQGFQRDPFLGRSGKRLRLRTEESTIEVLPKSNHYSGDHWLPAKRIELSQNWSQSPDSFKVGEPITRSITITAEGLMASQLPPLEIAPLDNVKYYPDQPQSEDTQNSQGVTAVKTERYAIVPSQPGRLTLPPLQLTWWDADNRRMQTATLPSQVINVGGVSQPVSLPKAANGSPSVQPLVTGVNADKVSQTGVSSHAFWFYLSLAASCCSLLFATLWIIERNKTRAAKPTPTHKHKPSSSEKQAFKSLQESLQARDLRNIRQHTLQWCQRLAAREGYNSSEITSLALCAQHWPALQHPLAELEASLYRQGETEFDVNLLRQAIDKVRRSPSTSPQSAPSLAPLYP